MTRQLKQGALSQTGAGVQDIQEGPLTGLQLAESSHIDFLCFRALPFSLGSTQVPDRNESSLSNVILVPRPQMEQAGAWGFIKIFPMGF